MTKPRTLNDPDAACRPSRNSSPGRPEARQEVLEKLEIFFALSTLRLVRLEVPKEI
jgi:hypothetical protein